MGCNNDTKTKELKELLLDMVHALGFNVSRLRLRRRSVLQLGFPLPFERLLELLLCMNIPDGPDTHLLKN